MKFAFGWRLTELSRRLRNQIWLGNNSYKEKFLYERRKCGDVSSLSVYLRKTHAKEQGMNVVVVFDSVLTASDRLLDFSLFQSQTWEAVKAKRPKLGG